MLEEIGLLTELWVRIPLKKYQVLTAIHVFFEEILKEILDFFYTKIKHLDPDLRHLVSIFWDETRYTSSLGQNLDLSFFFGRETFWSLL
jgi:hypothetical protein